MSQQTPYIGCKISLISMLDIRYEGILHSVNSEKSTIALSKVRSFGTEDRPTVHAVPSRDEVYEYIIFKATDIKDLVVCSSAGPDYDPAIISVSSVPDPPQEQQKNEKKENVGTVPPPPQQQQQWNAVGGSGAPAPVAPPQQPAARPSGGFGQGRRGAPPSSASTGGVPSAPADNDNNDVGAGGARNVPARPPPSSNVHGNNHYGGGQQQYQQRGPRGPPRAYQPHQPSNGHPQPQHYNHHHHNHQISAHHLGGGGISMNQLAAAVDPRLKFDSDFDFEEANEKFKEQLGAVVDGMANANIHDNAVSLEEIERSAIPSPPPENAEETFYNKKTSFFDNISCESLEKTEGRNNRPDWKKERMTNQETFGHSAVRSLTYQRRGPHGFNGGGAQGYHRYQNQNNFNSYNGGGGGNRNNYRNYHQNQQPPRHQQQQYGGGGGHGGGQQQYGGPSGGGGGSYHQNNRGYGGGSGRAGHNGNNRGSGW